MDKKHEIICDIKKVAVELGETPTRDQYLASGLFTRIQIEKEFDNYSVAVQACGLRSAKRKGRDIIKEVFQKDIEEKLKEFNSAPQVRLTLPHTFETILAIGDSHFPFVNESALTAVYQVIDEFKPKHIIQMGDLYDFFSASRFPRSVNYYTPAQEMEVGNRMSAEMWRTIHNLVPDSKKYQILGNHSARPMKLVLQECPELEQYVKKGIAPFFEFENVHTHLDLREVLEIQGIGFIHGHYSKIGEHRNYNSMNMVCGHSHKGGVDFKSYNNKILWELNAGYIGNPNAKALGYMPQRITYWTPGVGLIDRHGARFIPF